jgi:UDP-2-acetamido-2-deoxy-ribo-hexuluronate aminotransferase
LGIGPDDEVITVPFTWISSAEVIGLVGAKPVFVDIEPATFNMNTDLLDSAITPRTKAIMPVSLFGQMPDHGRINLIAARHNLPVIEDGAQSFEGSLKTPRNLCCSAVSRVTSSATGTVDGLVSPLWTGALARSCKRGA